MSNIKSHMENETLQLFRDLLTVDSQAPGADLISEDWVEGAFLPMEISIAIYSRRRDIIALVFRSSP